LADKSFKPPHETNREGHHPRQFAFLALRAIERGAFVDGAIDRVLHQVTLSDLDRSLLTELVYGAVRRQRTLDALIDQFAQKKASQQPPDLRLILHLGLYQLRYLDQIPPSAAVHTTVELAKQNGFNGLAGFVNGLLRTYIRQTDPPSTSLAGEQANADPLKLPTDAIARLGIQHSYPDWIVQVWVDQFGWEETEQLCKALNQPPHIDLRVNRLKTSVEEVVQAMTTAGVAIAPLPFLPYALRLVHHSGSIRQLPGFHEGWWTVQDASAQLVSHLLDPQPGELIVDACAAPGGKTTHMAELMGDRGTIWACDRTSSRLTRLQENIDRLGVTSIRFRAEDSRYIQDFQGQADRVLLDVPCSGLGTLNRHADARWRQSPTSVQELTQLQQELLHQGSTWVKPQGVLVYATCTIHPAENLQQITQFLQSHPEWHLEPPAETSPLAPFVTTEGTIEVFPPTHEMDGFFMVRLRR